MNTPANTPPESPTTQSIPEHGVDWTHELAEQLAWHWDNHLRPRMEGLTDDEYLWEPVPGCWTVRPRGQAGPEMPGLVAAGSGDHVIDFAFPEPVPAPVTTIAWRLGHLVVGVFGMRNASHFGGPADSYETHDYPGTAAGALAQLDEAHARWMAGITALDAQALATPCGPAEGPFGHLPMATLVLHIHREVIHHGAEIALLRDLYLHRTR